MVANKDKKCVLISGGAGYIGSTIAGLLVDSGHAPVVLDSLRTGKREFVSDYPFYHGDVADPKLLRQITSKHNIDIVVHCAALIVIPDSVAQPHEYYQENVTKSLRLIENMQDCGLERILFSSSASVCATSDTFEVTEQSPCDPQNPYSRTKLMVEFMLEDISRASNMRAISLRYFNPIGADPKMRSGMCIKKPTHVLGKMLEAVHGRIPHFEITGTSYNTRDGSGMRDFIHVADVAAAHVRAVERFDDILTDDTPFSVINIGTGRGTTVKELLAACIKVTGTEFPIVESPPRPGDSPGMYASCQKAAQLLDWRAEYSIEKAITHHNQWLEKRAKLLGY